MKAQAKESNRSMEQKSGGKMITQKEAKEITLEVWRYLRDHPSIQRKQDIKKSLYEKIRDMKGECPLCEYFDGVCSSLCPLEMAVYTFKCGYYCDFTGALEDTRRQKAAAKIVELVEAWEIE